MNKNRKTPKLIELKINCENKESVLKDSNNDENLEIDKNKKIHSFY